MDWVILKPRVLFKNCLVRDWTRSMLSRYTTSCSSKRSMKRGNLPGLERAKMRIWDANLVLLSSFLLFLIPFLVAGKCRQSSSRAICSDMLSYASLIALLRRTFCEGTSNPNDPTSKTVPIKLSVFMISSLFESRDM